MTQENKKILNEAFINVYKKEYSNIFDDRSEIRFSKSFDKNMQKLITHIDSAWTYTSVHTKRLLTILVAATLIFAGMMSVSAIRKSFIGFVVEVFDKFSIISIDANHQQTDNSLDEISTIYMPTYIPKEYATNEFNELPTMISAKYTTANNEKILFKQMNSEHALYTDTENVEINTFEINNLSVSLIEKSNTQNFIWQNDGYSFQLICKPSIDISEAKKIISGIQPDNGVQ